MIQHRRDAPQRQEYSSISSRSRRFDTRESCVCAGHSGRSGYTPATWPATRTCSPNSAQQLQKQMPELPEVETMVRGIRPEATGREILDVEYCPCERKPIEISPSTTTFRRKLRGQTISEVRRLAKRVVLCLSGGSFVVIEPRMSGLILVADPPTTEHRRVCWHLKPRRGKASSFEFWDRRGLGTVRLLTEVEMAELQERLGPDALEVDASMWKAILSSTRRPVKVAMLEQKLVAGIGNLYASEILHRAGISPQRSSQKITRPQCERIAEATIQVLETAIKYEGSTLGDGTYRNVLNQDGSYQNEHRVYDREGDTCPQCSQGVIKRIVQAQRSTFYCPKCQK